MKKLIHILCLGIILALVSCTNFVDESVGLGGVKTSASQLEFSSSSTVQNFSVTSGEKWTIQTPDWLSVNQISGRGYTWSVSLTSEENYGYDRTGTVTLQSSSVVVYVAVSQQGKPATGIINGHEWVDLGLPSGLKWATCNVGASSPSDYGNYYAWGETSTKSYYDWSTYRYCNGSGYSLTKYNTDSSYGTVDNRTRLEMTDDAARANWGGSWRMPTDAEWTELRNNCNWTWTTQDGKNGYRVTSRTNGNSIFLPAAGLRIESRLSNAGSSGIYWSSSLYSGYPSSAWYVGFNSGEVARSDSSRCFGFSVRPVSE